MQSKNGHRRSGICNLRDPREFKPVVGLKALAKEVVRTLECSPSCIVIPSSCLARFRRAGYFVFNSRHFPAWYWVSRVSGRGCERRSAFKKQSQSDQRKIYSSGPNLWHFIPWDHWKQHAQQVFGLLTSPPPVFAPLQMTWLFKKCWLPAITVWWFLGCTFDHIRFSNPAPLRTVVDHAFLLTHELV